MTYSNIEQQGSHVAAIRYMKSRLVLGRTLAKFLLETIDRSEGTVFTLSPRQLNPTELMEFEIGHVDTEGLASAGAISPILGSEKELAELISHLLREPQKFCFLENWLATPDDPWVRRAKSHIVTLGTEVYHVMSSAETRISEAIREASQIPVFVGAIGNFSINMGSSIMAGQTVTADSLKSFAETVECIFVGAYDGEGYVLWFDKRPEEQALDFLSAPSVSS
jgi:hypothetical protein